MNLPSDTLSDEIEPFQLREKMIVRTPRGRLATQRSYQHLGRTWQAKEQGPHQGNLFDA